METPVFRLGLVGFDENEEQLLEQGVGRYRQVRWRCGPPEGADAWMLNSPRAGRVHGSCVRVIASRHAGDGATLMLDLASRPTAVLAPAPQALQQLAGLSFELRSRESVAACLAALDRRLERLRTLYWVAAHLVKCNEMVGKAVYELRAGAQLLAIADMKGTVSILPGLREEQLDQATWKHRARTMLEVPADFDQHALAELLWIYATRTRVNLLPERYTDCPLYLRRPPRVPTALVEDVHLQVIRELAIAPTRFIDLADRTGLDAKVLGRALAALYYVGSVTSNPERAWAASQQGGIWSSRASLRDEGAQPFRTPSEGQPSTTPLV